MKILLIILLLLSSCISIKKHHRLMMSYQLDHHFDTVWIFDRGRFVGSFIHNDSSWNNPYDSIFIKDNQ